MTTTGERKPSAPSQRLEALDRANAVRRERAELKRALRSGAVDIAELLIGPPGFLLSARLSQILLAAPGYGQVRVDRLLKRCRISPLKTIGGLSERQREELARALGARRGQPRR
jgi:hypothetical protein